MLRFAKLPTKQIKGDAQFIRGQTLSETLVLFWSKGRRPLLQNLPQ
jgi:hypothetical protein